MCIVCRPVIVDGDAERNNYMKNIIDGERISIKFGKAHGAGKISVEMIKYMGLAG